MFEVKDNKVSYYEENELLAYVTYPFIDQNTVLIDHTFVDPVLRGKGIASKLLEEAYNDIKSRGLKAKLSCTYAINYFDKHEELNDILI